MNQKSKEFSNFLEEDIEWLLKQPDCKERSHILQVLEEAPWKFYPIKTAADFREIFGGFNLPPTPDLSPDDITKLLSSK